MFALEIIVQECSYNIEGPCSDEKDMLLVRRSVLYGGNTYYLDLENDIRSHRLMMDKYKQDTASEQNV